MCTCRPKELTRLMQHAVLGETVLINFEVTRFENACILLHLLEIRVHATLPRLMCDDRHINGRLFAAIPVSGRFAFVDSDPTFVLFSDIGSHVRGIILIRLHMRASCRGGIETTVVTSLSLLHKVFEDSKIAFVLITVAKKDKGRMVAIFV